MTDAGTWIRAVLTCLLLVVTAWWLIVVSGTLNVAPIEDGNGNVLDEYQRAKDILLAVLPLLTLALGYWFGSAGKEKADQKAETAKQQLDAAIDVGDPGLLKKAKEKHPESFGLA